MNYIITKKIIAQQIKKKAALFKNNFVDSLIKQKISKWTCDVTPRANEKSNEDAESVYCKCSGPEGSVLKESKYDVKGLVNLNDLADHYFYLDSEKDDKGGFFES